MLFGLILGVAIGYSIRPAFSYYDNWVWHRKSMRYSKKRSFFKSFDGIWS